MSKRYQAGILTASYNGLKVPNAPTIGTATAGAGSASVTFTAPSNVGGGAITSYTVISSPGSITGTGSSSPITVSGLTNGTAYTFTVVATNAYGTGPASAASNSVTPSLNYIEEVFSTYLYTGNGSTQTITNGINLSTNGGLVWAKMRSNGSATGHVLSDTARGPSQKLDTSSTGASSNWTPYGISAFGSTGFTVADDGAGNYVTNNSGVNYVSWTFRKQPKFFDVVTYTGDGTTTQTINHSLGCQPGFILLKATSSSGSWFVLARSDATNYKYLFLNSTNGSGGNYAQTSCASDTQINLGYIANNIDSFFNLNGTQYVAYLFAHNAGGFGLTGTDNVISCGSYTGDGAANGQLINLGYEAQWVMIKQTNTSGSGWWMTDTMRGWTVNGSSGGDANLYANTSGAESDQVLGQPEAQGFRPINDNVNQSGQTYIYIAIRKGPMKVPTSGTSVFLPATSANDSTATNFGFPIDVFWENNLGGSTYNTITATRLSGNSSSLVTSSTNAAITFLGSLFGGGLQNSYTAGVFGSGNSVVQYGFLRAPSFMDVVCYDGNGTTDRAISHNLGAVPELIINRPRNYADYWEVYQKDVGLNSYFYLNSTAAPASNPGNWSTMTSSVFGAGYAYSHNYSGRTYITYLFATCPGVSKVGSYVGNDVVGRVIDCGFTTGARFIMLKKTSTTSDWYVYDTARGIVSGNEASISLNTTAAQSGSSDVIDPDASGFAVGTGASNFFNETGVTYIFLAIA